MSIKGATTISAFHATIGPLFYHLELSMKKKM